MKVAFIQADIKWESRSANLLLFNSFFEKLTNTPDLVVLPEMFTTGFTMNTSLAEAMNGASVTWMMKKAEEYRCCVCGSLIIEENGRFYNRFIFAFNNGLVKYYDKSHLFRMVKENVHFEKGQSNGIFNHMEWGICPLVCYDLRFPVWCRNTENYDLIICVANWPDSRKNAWEVLLKARAIENLSYVIGVNRVGLDGNGLLYSGGSMIIGPDGKVIAEAGNVESVTECAISLNDLRQFRESFPAFLDMDDFELV